MFMYMRGTKELKIEVKVKYFKTAYTVVQKKRRLQKICHALLKFS